MCSVAPRLRQPRHFTAACDNRREKQGLLVMSGQSRDRVTSLDSLLSFLEVLDFAMAEVI